LTVAASDADSAGEDQPMKPPVPGGTLDLNALERWLSEVGVGCGPVTDVTRIGGGTQNVLLRFRLGADWLVLRHPPLPKRPESDKVTQREIHVLRALRATGVPVPRLRAACLDPTVLGSACYVTDFVDGFNPAAGFPPAFQAKPAWQEEAGLAMVDALVELSRLPAEKLVAAGFRPPDGWLERQPGRWLAQLTGYGIEDLVPVGEHLADWLRGHPPRHWRPGVIHGDFHLGNVLVRQSAPRLAAVVDWELATVGDPLLDLAHLLVGWPVGNPGSPHAGIDAPALPGRRQMLDRYLGGGGQVHDLSWYGVLACFRLGVLLEGSLARARAGAAPTSVGERLHRYASHLFTQGQQLASGEQLV
jgi:aminoglycoside phosphotransferase (APT) family kinase protein